jgi:subtilisin family serine protease
LKAIRAVILDSGYTLSHPDLPQPIEYVYGSSGANDSSSHGTCVSGILAAKRDNGYGLAGAAVADILAYKVYADGFLLDDYHAALAAVPYSAARVMNISLGSSDGDQEESTKIETCILGGVTVVAAAGNSPTDATTVYPAAYPDVISVGATQQDDSVAPFSVSSGRIDIAAPGAHIITTSSYDSGYAWVDGTSFAAPLVTAACVLINRKLPGIEPPDVLALLQQLIAPGTAGNGRGAGRLDLSTL